VLATISGVSPTGTVTFYEGTTVLGTAPISAGLAPLTFTPTTGGTHVYTASYSGDAKNAALAVAATPALTVIISNKPNAVADPQVQANLDSQIKSLDGFGTTQTNNIAGRLGNIRSSSGSTFVSNLQVNGLAVAGNISPVSDEPNNKSIRSWISGDITFGKRDGTDVTSFTTSGLSFGLDTEISQSLIAGLAIGYGRDDTKIGNNGTRNKSQNVSITFYGDYAATPSTFIDVLAGYGRGSVDTSRFSTAGNLLLNGDRGMNQFFGALSVTHESRFEAFTIAPYGKLIAQHIIAEAYTEDGGSPWALSYGELDSTSLNAIAGFTTSYKIPVSWGSLTAKAHAEYNATIAGSYNQAISYADELGLSGTITNHGLASDQFNTGLDFDFAFDKTSGSLGYQYSLSGDKTAAHSLKATIGFQF
jgi:uncharacterized protein with beta-barrel porin domain